MNCTTIINNIIIPIICALIGGGLTLIGVILTIKHETKIRNENKKLEVKPWLVLLGAYNTTIDECGNNSIHMATCLDDYHQYRNNVFVLNINNTDNGMCIVDRIISNNTTFIPIKGNYVVEKNRNINILVHIGKSEKATGTEIVTVDINKIVLIIKDIYGTEYLYEIKMDLSKEEFTMTEL